MTTRKVIDSITRGTTVMFLSQNKHQWHDLSQPGGAAKRGLKKEERGEEGAVNIILSVEKTCVYN